MGERQPIPVVEIIWALEREAGNTDTSPQWQAASALRRMTDWESRTLMCHIDKRGSQQETISDQEKP